VPALVFAVVSALVALFERQPAPVLPTSAAGEHGIQLEEVEGTGAGGRITRKDIQKIIDSGMQQNNITG
jgi:pyruvate/2-oxoglutarate dehydrogenase complex dihydrolipoamide acyltransferase (E2) component